MIIQATDLEQTYTSGSRRLTVLHGVSLDVAAGEILAIVGPSGSGKTTLLGLLAGLDRPTSGRIMIDGHDLAHLSEDDLARFRADRVGFVFQSFQLIPTLTAIENVSVPLELGSRGSRHNGPDNARRARDLLARVGLGDRLDHYPVQLSGGEQQRVAVARAFANGPKILFADEPTGNLDAETGATVIDLLVHLNREEGATLILVTHDEKLAARTHRIVRLEAGAIVSDGPRMPGPV